MGPHTSDEPPREEKKRLKSYKDWFSGKNSLPWLDEKDEEPVEETHSEPADAIPEFDASSLGEAELDDMSLTGLLTEVFNDVQQGKLLRHGFFKGLSEHGFDFAVDTFGTQVPYMASGLVSAILGTRAGMTEEDLFDEVILTEYGFEKEKRDPGAIGDIIARKREVTPEELPSWMTHDLPQAIRRNVTEINLGLREMAERLGKKGYAGLASEVKQYALKSQRAIDSEDEEITSDETGELFGKVLRALSGDTDPRIADYAGKLNAIMLSSERKKHKDLKTELKRRQRGLDKDEGTLDDVFSKGAGEQWDEKVADIMGKLPDSPSLPYIIAAAGAAGLFVLGHTVLGNAIENRLHREDLTERTPYAAMVEEMPDEMEGFNNTSSIVVNAGNLSWLMDRGYMDANAELPFDYRGQGEILLMDIEDTLVDIEEVIVHYQDPGLAHAMGQMTSAGFTIASSIDHSYHIEDHLEMRTRQVCSTDSDGDLECHQEIYYVTVFDWRDDWWEVDHAQGKTGMEALEQAFYKVTLTESGLAVAELDLRQFTGKNSDNSTMEAWNTAAAGQSSMNGRIQEFNQKWDGSPTEHHERSYVSESRQHWWVEDMVWGINGAANDITQLNAVQDRLLAYEEALNTAEDRLYARKPASEVFAEDMGNSSIDILRALDYPKGKGHNYQEEINKYVKRWRWGLGITGIVVAGVGLYMYENSDRGRRYGGYRRNVWP